MSRSSIYAEGSGNVSYNVYPHTPSPSCASMQKIDAKMTLSWVSFFLPRRVEKFYSFRSFVVDVSTVRKIYNYLERKKFFDRNSLKFFSFIFFNNWDNTFRRYYYNVNDYIITNVWNSFDSIYYSFSTRFILHSNKLLRGVELWNIDARYKWIDCLQLIHKIPTPFY